MANERLAPALVFSFAAAGITGGVAEGEGDVLGSALGGGFGSGEPPHPDTSASSMHSTPQIAASVWRPRMSHPLSYEPESMGS